MDIERQIKWLERNGVEGSHAHKFAKSMRAMHEVCKAADDYHTETILRGHACTKTVKQLDDALSELKQITGE